MIRPGFITAVANHFCLNLPAAFTKPGQSLLAEPCKSQSCEDRGRGSDFFVPRTSTPTAIVPPLDLLAKNFTGEDRPRMHIRTLCQLESAPTRFLFLRLM